MLLGARTKAVSAPLLVPPTAMTSSSVLIRPASVAMQEISQATFVPCPKRRRTCAVMPSTWIVPNLLFTALPRVPKACAVVRILAPLFWMVLRCVGWSS